MSLKQELQWQEPYVSKSLNSKLSGALPPGIYQGFAVTPGGGMVLDISPSSDYPRSVAVVDRGGYNFTVTSGEAEHFTVQNGTSGTHYLCLDSEYVVGGGGSSQFSLLIFANIQPYHVVLARLVIPGGTSTITAAMIDPAGRVTRSLHTVNPNHFINGAFDIWQLGTSQTSSGLGSDDKWYNEHSGSSKVHTRQSFSDDFFFPDGTKAPRFFSQTVVTSVNNQSNYVRKTYRVPNVRNFSGQYVTISFEASADSEKDIAVDARQFFGAGGSASVEGIGAQKVGLTTVFEKKAVTLFIPAITGKTVGSGGDDFVEFRLWFDAGSSFNAYTSSLGQQFGTFKLADMKLETGQEATQNKRRLYEEELALCSLFPSTTTGSAVVVPPGVPPGAVMHFARNTPPAGWIAANGATVSRVAYPYLFIAIGTMFGAGDGSTTFKLPDFRGEFIRGWDDGRGVDANRAFGTQQSDALQNITGFAGTTMPYHGSRRITGGAMTYTNVIPGGTDGGGGSHGSALIDMDASRVARTAAETRPRNVALLTCIKY